MGSETVVDDDTAAEAASTRPSPSEGEGDDDGDGVKAGSETTVAEAEVALSDEAADVAPPTTGSLEGEA